MWVLMGLCIGSFISVVVHRLPRMLDEEERGLTPTLSLSYPGSTCPCCRNPLTWRDNIPVLGYLIHKGKCRQCGVPIPVRYLMLELIAGGWALAATLLWHDPVQVLGWSIFGWYLLTMAWMDAESQWLPDVLTVGLLWLGLLLSTSAGALTLPVTAITASAGTYCALSIFQAVAGRIRGQEVLGGGDVKLLAAFAAWFGPIHLLYLATAANALFIAQVVFFRKRGATAFGPALCISALGFAVYTAR